MKINKLLIMPAVLLMGATLASAKVIDSNVATVNGQAILSSQYNKMVNTIIESYKAKNPQLLENPQNIAIIKQEVLNELITETLLNQNAKKEGIKVKDSELADGINEIKVRFSIDPLTGQKITDQKQIDAAFNAELKKEGLTYSQFEARIKDQIALRKLIDNVVNSKISAPTQEQVKALYDDVTLIMSGNEQKVKALPKDRLERAVPLAAKLNQLTAEQIKISPVFIKFENNTEAEIKAKEQKAKDVRAKIKRGNMTMVDIIQKYSDDKTPLQTGGEMILIKGAMPKDFDDQIFAVKVGDVSKPIKTDNGFYVIKVQAKNAKRDFTFDQVAPDMGQYLAAIKMQEELNSYLNTLKEKSKIKVMVKFDEPAPAQNTAKAEPAKTEPAKTEAKKTEKADDKKADNIKVDAK
ncbi:MAG: SurA N-terminal domain-containing protein [Elusimicrobiaceae bacterium]|nr:SurA N-terminal domain-containing protein [Elusimicrobiaceae bacterium]